MKKQGTRKEVTRLFQVKHLMTWSQTQGAEVSSLRGISLKYGHDKIC